MYIYVQKQVVVVHKGTLIEERDILGQNLETNLHVLQPSHFYF